MAAHDTLSGLAELARLVEQDVARLDKVTDEETYDTMRESLNRLQVVAGECAGVVGARVAWFNHGLANFERAVDDVVNGGAQWQLSPGASADRPEWLFMRWSTIDYFLRRSYLGTDAFVQMFARVRLACAALADKEGYADGAFWKTEGERLEAKLLKGGF